MPCSFNPRCCKHGQGTSSTDKGGSEPCPAPKRPLTELWNKWYLQLRIHKVSRRSGGRWTSFDGVAVACRHVVIDGWSCVSCVPRRRSCSAHVPHSGGLSRGCELRSCEQSKESDPFPLSPTEGEGQPTARCRQIDARVLISETDMCNCA